MTPVDVGNTKKTVHFKNCLGVFQGGGCKAIAFIGAYEEARKRGVYFSEVAGTSAGSIFAALISAGATPEYLDRLVNNTCFSDFNSPVEKMVSKKYGSKIGHINKFLPRTKKIKKYKDIFYFLLNLGLYSSAQLESWLNERLKELLGVSEGIINFSDLKIPLHVIATDIQNQNSITWNYNNSPNMSVAYAVRCSCSIPGYFQPVDMKYVDGGLVSNLPTFSVQDDDIHYEKFFVLPCRASQMPYHV
ncbi:patatin-like phospholipase family protein [Aeromonas dhakensis]